MPQIKKSLLLSYVLWAFLGGLGAHRFYLGRFTGGLVLIFIYLLSLVILIANADTENTAWLITGLFGIVFAFGSLTVDAFRIPSWVRGS